MNAGCSTDENRLEVNAEYTADDGNMWGLWMAWNCYCDADGGITPYLRPGFQAHVSKRTGAFLYKECEDDGDCGGCATTCVTHESGHKDCRGDCVGDEQKQLDHAVGAGLGLIDPYAFAAACFPDVQLSCNCLLYTSDAADD